MSEDSERSDGAETQNGIESQASVPSATHARAKQLLNRLFPYFSRIPGTPQAMEKHKNELFATLKTHIPPNLFVTFSAADSQWPQLFRFVLPDKSEQEILKLNSGERMKLLKEHPILAAIFFRRRWQFFLNTFCKCVRTFRTMDPWGGFNDTGTVLNFNFGDLLTYTAFGGCFVI